MSPSRDRLPVEGIRDDLMAALRRGPHRNGAAVLSSPTGSGKSTQVPRWFGESRVLVIEPRRVACRSLAQRVASLEKVKLGHEVGYHVRDERRAGKATRILFATPGVVLRIFDRIDGFDTVIVDEFHERGLEVDLLLALLLDRRKRGQLGGLIIMSATLDGEKIAQHLAAQHLAGEHVRAEGRVFPVSTRHLPGKALLPDVRGLEERVLAAVHASEDLEGDVLVFLPGKGEIASCARALERRRDLMVLGLHGGLTLEDQSRVFDRSPKRKIILATNVAETSLTVPGVGVVIDSGLVRQTRYHQGRGFLTLVPIARDSADQRAGRAGRTAAGTVLRLWSEAAQLEARTAPEIHRESLVPLVLSAAACGADPSHLPFLDPPKEHALEAAISELQALGALDDSTRLTSRGERLFGLPLDPFHGRLLVEAEERKDPGLLADMVDLVSALSVDRPIPVDRPGDDEEAPTLEDRCDARALVHTVRGDRGESSSHPVLREIRSVRRRLRQAFELSETPPPGLDRQRLAMAILAADRRAVHIARRRGRRVAWSNGGTEIEVSRKSSLGESDDIEAVAVLSTMALGLGGRDVRVIATQVMPLPISWLLAAGLGRDRLAKLELQSERIVALIERTYAGKTLGQREKVPEGPLAREAVAELFTANRLFKSVADASRDNLEAARLAQRLAGSKTTSKGSGSEDEAPYWLTELVGRFPDPVPDFPTWLANRLEELGVESGDDIALLDGDDLLFPAIPEHLQAELDRVWPRSIKIDGVSYRISYELERDEAILRPEKGKPKKMPDAFFLPRFPGLSVHVEFKGALHKLR